MALRDAVTAKPQGMELDHVATIIEHIGKALSAVHEKMAREGYNLIPE
jgi:hypothetical protein